LIADHDVVSSQTNSQANVIAAVDNLIKGVTKVMIQGNSTGATSASITSGANTGKLVTVFVTCWITLLLYNCCLIP
jgi:hypothetical protein